MVLLLELFCQDRFILVLALQLALSPQALHLPPHPPPLNDPTKSTYKVSTPRKKGAQDSY